MSSIRFQASDVASRLIDAEELIAGPVSTDDDRSIATDGSTPTTTATAAVTKPNKGSSVPDWQAIGENQKSKKEWLASRGVDLAKRVMITKLAHMRYQHPDLAEITTFLLDFGLHVVKENDDEMWFRGYGPDNYVYYAKKGPRTFLGGAFEVEGEDELQKVLQIPNVKVVSNGIEAMSNAPGGGKILTIQDPAGFPVSFIYGQSPPEKTFPQPERLLINDEINKPRQRRFQRFNPGPAEVYKVGHFGLVIGNFDELLDWYTRYFNIVPSDILYVPERSPSDSSSNAKPTPRKEVTMFAHIDRGSDPVDHHTLFLSANLPDRKDHVHHCSFEIHDYDTQALGHQWLAQQGYKSVWGVGRHILGSQIFDYWWDTTGNMIEHYADGDLVSMETPLGYAPAGHEGLAVWGPEVPKAFME